MKLSDLKIKENITGRYTVKIRGFRIPQKDERRYHDDLGRIRMQRVYLIASEAGNITWISEDDTRSGKDILKRVRRLWDESDLPPYREVTVILPSGEQFDFKSYKQEGKSFELKKL